VALVKTCTRLAARGVDAWSMSPRQVSFLVRCEAESHADDIRRMAIACRMAQADKKGWEKAMKSLDGED
jgi:hypothetical protein